MDDFASRQFEELRREPVSAIARDALGVRLGVVWHFVRQAAQERPDVESIHQLRVATRRARSAQQIFADLLAEDDNRWLRKRLRHIRRSAAGARDLDVLSLRFAKLAQKRKYAKSLRPLISRAATLRELSQQPLVASYRAAKKSGFKKKVRALRNNIRWRGDKSEPTFGVAARHALSPMIDTYFSAADADLANVASLHELRIAGKRLRYAMELMTGALEPSARVDLDRAFRRAQRKLGKINDCDTAIAMYNDWIHHANRKSIKRDLSTLIRKSQHRMDQRCAEFHRWWTPERIAELKRLFAEALDMTT